MIRGTGREDGGKVHNGQERGWVGGGGGGGDKEGHKRAELARGNVIEENRPPKYPHMSVRARLLFIFV